MHVSLPETRSGSRIQTWNRYAYVGNRPLSSVDPLGLDPMSNLPNCGASFACWNQYASTNFTGPHAGGTPQGAVGSSPWDAAGFVNVQTVSNSSELLAGDLPQWNPSQLVYLENGTPHLTIGGWSFSSSSSSGELLPGIVFSQTSATTWSFESDRSFSETVMKLQSAGLRKNLLDALNINHPNQLDLRDTSLTCSVHVDVNMGSGQLPGSPTTGTVHLDTFNPFPHTGTPPIDISLFWLHMGLEQTNIYPGWKGCR
jgi:hypothetical protein